MKTLFYFNGVEQVKIKEGKMGVETIAVNLNSGKAIVSYETGVTREIISPIMEIITDSLSAEEFSKSLDAIISMDF